MTKDEKMVKRINSLSLEERKMIIAMIRQQNRIDKVANTKAVLRGVMGGLRNVGRQVKKAYIEGYSSSK